MDRAGAEAVAQDAGGRSESRYKSASMRSTRTRTAFHEAGHAVLSAALGHNPQHVSIRPDERTLGRSGARMSSRATSRVQVHLAGYAAEHVLTGRRPRQLDQDVGFALLARLDRGLRDAFVELDGRDGQRAVDDVLRTGVFAGDDEIRREVDRFYEITRESLSAVWSSVKHLAAALLEREELDREAVDAVIGDVDVFTPVITVQRRHGLLLGSPRTERTETVVEAAMKPTRKSKKPAKDSSSSFSGGADARRAALVAAFKADPKLASIIAAFQEDTEKSGAGRKFGANGLKVKRKLFALFTQGTLVVKLPKHRVEALVAARVGRQFDPGHGRLMKEWLTVTSTNASWTELAKEAYDFVKGSTR